MSRQRSCPTLGQRVVTTETTFDDLFTGRANKPLIDQAVKSSVKRTSPEGDLALRYLRDLADDGVAVQGPVSQRSEHQVGGLTKLRYHRYQYILNKRVSRDIRDRWG